MSGDTDNLMDIHDAARFLGVSEVSIRRYTNSGALPCLRVGGRRERRFQRQDLENFAGVSDRTGAPRGLDNAGDAATAWETDPARSACYIEGMAVPWGGHLCQLYETDRGRTQMAIPFLAEGLVAGDACFLVASEPVRTVMLGSLETAAGGLDAHIEAGRLRPTLCAKSGPEMLSHLDESFGVALEQGFSRLRLVGDMAWFLDQDLDGDDLVNFETRYDCQIGHSYPIVSLCLYDARRFTGVDLLHALKSHSDTFELPLGRFLLR